MTQHQWDLIGYAVWALVIWVTVKQFMQSRKEVKGKGLRLLLGDWLMFAPVPWIVYCLASRGTWEQVGWTLGLGVVLAIPYVLTTKFMKKAGGGIYFEFNLLFYIFLFGFPYLRYMIRDRVFHTYPILTPDYHPDIELMLAMYIGVLVFYTFVWRVYMYMSFKRLKQQSDINALRMEEGQHV
ncbi:DUF1453 family protein [Paenibacillus sp. D2_2]|uniref:CcdC protein domain-containing protein n=1 Tax=Paenibacillus sp. D2_2 TaxID=3073092 RepID=UPI0028156DB6|nr:CcdC protein domain-containing protein [Paenibacillus sp. D2_2]WMT41211.1 DUF1453 family protein [Paenibacillus sp. D2_2]